MTKMTMDANELRALADALEPMAKAPRFEDFDVPAFCAWVRACADAEPVGEVTNLGGILSTPLSVGTKLYAHPAPAVPQAEPCIGNDPMCPCQDGDACHYKDSADGTKAWPVPQSEPKRKDQSMRDLLAIIHCDGGHHTEAVGLDQSIKDAQAAVCELKRELAMGKREPLSELPPLPEPRLIGGIGDYREHWDADQMREYGLACERAAYERAAQECERHASDYEQGNPVVAELTATAFAIRKLREAA